MEKYINKVVNINLRNKLKKALLTVAAVGAGILALPNIINAFTVNNPTATTNNSVQWSNLPGKSYFTISPIGLSNSTALPNNSADFGPDTPNTQSSGIQEAFNAIQNSGGKMSTLVFINDANFITDVPITYGSAIQLGVIRLIGAVGGTGNGGNGLSSETTSKLGVNIVASVNFAANHAGSYIFTFGATDGSYELWGIYLENFTIYGQFANASSGLWKNNGIYIGKCNQGVIRNIDIANCLIGMDNNGAITGEDLVFNCNNTQLINDIYSSGCSFQNVGFFDATGITRTNSIVEIGSNTQYTNVVLDTAGPIQIGNNTTTNAVSVRMNNIFSQNGTSINFYGGILQINNWDYVEPYPNPFINFLGSNTSLPNPSLITIETSHFILGNNPFFGNTSYTGNTVYVHLQGSNTYGGYSQGTIPTAAKIRLDIVNVNLSSIGPQISSISTNPPISATVYQNTNLYGITIYQPVTFASGVTSTFIAAVGSTNSPTALPTVSNPSVILGAVTQVFPLHIPAGWYYSFTITGVGTSLGTAIIIGD